PWRRSEMRDTNDLDWTYRPYVGTGSGVAGEGVPSLRGRGGLSAGWARRCAAVAGHREAAGDAPHAGDDPPVEWLHRPVVVLVAVVVGKPPDHLVEAGHSGRRDLAPFGDHPPSHLLGAHGHGE